MLLIASLVSAFSLAIHPTPIYCTNMVGAPWWAQGVYHNTASVPTIEIRQYLCDAIINARTNKPYNKDDLRTAIWLVGHEQAHADGISDERVADEIGWLRFREDAGMLGINPSLYN